MRDGFLHRIKLEQHPAYGTQKSALDAAVASGETWLPMDPSEPDGDTAGLYRRGPDSDDASEFGIYFDVTGPLWAHACSGGHVEDLGAVPYDAWGDVTALLRIMLLGAGRVESAASPEERESARAVLKGFYGFAAMHCSWQCELPQLDNEWLQAFFAHPVLKPTLTEPTIDWVDERFPVPKLPSPDETGMFNPEQVTFWRRPHDS